MLTIWWGRNNRKMELNGQFNISLYLCWVLMHSEGLNACLQMGTAGQLPHWPRWQTTTISLRTLSFPSLVMPKVTVIVTCVVFLDFSEWDHSVVRTWNNQDRVGRRTLLISVTPPGICHIHSCGCMFAGFAWYSRSSLPDFICFSVVGYLDHF